MEGGLTAEEFLEKNRLAMETIPDVLNIAMMIETQALDLYLRYSNRTKDEKSKGVLFEIAQEEKAHLAALGCVWIRRCKFFPKPDAPYADQKKVSRLWMRRNGPDEIVATEILPRDIAHIHTDIPG